MSGRRPALRASVHRRRRSRQSKSNEQLAVVIAGIVGLGLVVTLVKWLLVHWWVLAAFGVIAAAAGALWWHQLLQRRRWELARARGLRLQLAEIDALHHSEFEHAIRDLMFRDGCADAVRTGGRGDAGADVIATDPSGRRWVFQCKHRKNGLAGSPIGTPDLQRLNGTARPVHHADVVVMLTNGRFTRDAIPFSRSQKIHLVDRQTLARWAAGSWPLWELLPRVPAPRRPSSP